MEAAELRSIETRGFSELPSGQKGFFHCWCKEALLYDEYSVFIPKTYAVVELLNGEVHMIDPRNIKFTTPYRPK